MERRHLDELLREAREAERPADARRDADPQQHRALHAVCDERADEQRGEHAEHDLRGGDVSHRDERVLVGHDEVDHAEADERLEDADRDGGRVLQVARHHFLQVGARAQRGEQREGEPHQEDDREGGAVLDPLGDAHAVREVGVEPHPRRETERQVGGEADEAAAEDGGEGGGESDGLEGQPRAREHRGVDDEDVGHRHEGGHARAQLRRKRRPSRRDAEVAVEGLEERWHRRRCGARAGEASRGGGWGTEEGARI
mmetsp:Transcript_6727/g.16395  ORF Transcript_6727/g.16395 Transcript_6727/m.16395 type:complete len:256 (+) Transcript_6727:1066-1833(+)